MYLEQHTAAAKPCLFFACKQKAGQETFSYLNPGWENVQLSVRVHTCYSVSEPAPRLAFLWRGDVFPDPGVRRADLGIHS